MERKHYLPLGIDVAGLKCLVVGGGRVGARKTLKLAEGGARVTVLSPEISERLSEHVDGGEIIWRREEYDPSHLDGFVLVVAATSDPALNIEIGRQAEERGILSCVVSPGRFSRVIFPATHVNGDTTIAVHSNGRDCAQSRKVRDRVARMLSEERLPPSQLVVFGLRRTDVPADVFDSLTREFNAAKQTRLQGKDILFLTTCLRWECYFIAPFPHTVIHDLLQLVEEKRGILLESHKNALYTKTNARAYHHLLRVATGLDSSLRGETEIVGQMRSAAARWLDSNSSDLQKTFDSCLLAQKAIRRKSGFADERKTWADATISFLEKRIPPLSSRRISLIGCGKLSEAVAMRLLKKGVAVFPFSRRAKTTGVSWCSHAGLTTHDPDELSRFLPHSQAAVLTSGLSDIQHGLVDECADSNDLVVIDLTGNNSNLLRGIAGGRYFGLADVANLPLSGEQAARIETAERLAFEQTLRWYANNSHISTPNRNIKLGGRSSELSRIQIVEAMVYMKTLLPNVVLDVVTMDTPCDRNKRTPLPEILDNDFFTHDLDLALLDGRIDVAIHSAKDLPASIPDGLSVAVLTPAFAPWECLVARDHSLLFDLPKGALIGTSSMRRRHRLSELRPDFVPSDIRGNVPDRMAQLEDGKYDALILAAAGLIRLNMPDRISQVFTLAEFPAQPGQGALALIVREDDTELLSLLKPMDLADREGLPWA